MHMSLNRIMIVGECWNPEDERTGRPFSGTSGSLLNQMLAQVGISRNESYLTNVFNLLPGPKPEVDSLCGTKAQALAGYSALRAGRYVRHEYAGELVRLYREIATERPNIIIALGASAAWALLGTSGIKKIRGAPSTLSGPAFKAVGSPIKVLPTYHPAAIMREWSNRAIVIADLEKAKNESLYPELRRPKREIWIEPTLADLLEFEHNFIAPASSLSIDIETAGDQITCVGFAPSVDRCIVVPLVDPMQADGNYWRSLGDELKAIEFITRWCNSTRFPLFNNRVKHGVGQNFLYDMNRLWRGLGIAVANEDDTMLLHHALQPEMDKGLGFLATLYTSELAWKFMRTKHETLKKEE
jgi:uracil-DNA glycosylase